MNIQVQLSYSRAYLPDQTRNAHTSSKNKKNTRRHHLNMARSTIYFNMINQLIVQTTPEESCNKLHKGSGSNNNRGLFSRRLLPQSWAVNDTLHEGLGGKGKRGMGRWRKTNANTDGCCTEHFQAAEVDLNWLGLQAPSHEVLSVTTVVGHACLHACTLEGSEGQVR